jgi:porin
MSKVIAISLPSAYAYELSHTLTVGGVLAGAYQFQFLDHDPDGDDEGGGGAVPFQPELSLRPTSADEFFVKLGFAADNGINDETPFALSPWAADLEDDVKDINGRSRDILLVAWYKHAFTLAPENTLGLSAGLIDATAYLEENAFADDEYTQFMHEAFVNGPQSFLPSYDTGGVLEWDINRFALRVVVMNVGENDDGHNFTFFGVQLGYTAQTALGEGTYRILLDGTTEAFLNPSGTDKKMLGALTFSFDQELGDLLGAFLRVGWQKDGAAVDFKALYSGGVDINGKLWDRLQDNIGIAYAYLDGGNTGIDHSHVFEAYVRFVLNDYIAVTADLQYIDEDYDEGKGPCGWIPGIRLTAEF